MMLTLGLGSCCILVGCLCHDRSAHAMEKKNRRPNRRLHVRHLVTGMVLQLQSTFQISDRTTRYLDSLCVCNEVEDARRISRRAAYPYALIAKRHRPGDKPMLGPTCEEGQIDIVNLCSSTILHWEQKITTATWRCFKLLYPAGAESQPPG
jgi:hypothetical protein